MFILYIFCFPLFSCFVGYFIGLLVQQVFQSIMTDQLYNSTPVPSNLLLDLNLKMNFNPETMVHDDMYNVKY